MSTEGLGPNHISESTQQHSVEVIKDNVILVPNYASHHKYIWKREAYLHTINLGTTDERSPSNTPSTS
jgi:hypothetical protein